MAAWPRARANKDDKQLEEISIFNHAGEMGITYVEFKALLEKQTCHFSKPLHVCQWTDR